MPVFIIRKRRISLMLPILLLMIPLILPGCSNIRTNQIDQKPKEYSCECIDVRGVVLGNPMTNSSIYLYRAEGTDYESIVAVINAAVPEQMAYVSSNKSFSFPCLQPGYYILSISASAFDYFVGSPIAAKGRQCSLKVDPVLQGGNSRYLFSVFSIERIS